MIQSSKAITLVLISAASILAGYQVFDRAYDDDARNGFGPTTRSSSSSSYWHHYYGRSYGSGGSYGGGGSYGSGAFDSPGSGSSAHGTSRGGFGGTGHAVGS